MIVVQSTNNNKIVVQTSIVDFPRKKISVKNNNSTFEFSGK